MADMTKMSLKLLVRTMSQRVTLMTALKDVQILVFPAAAKVYNECKFISTKLGSLHKHLDANKVLAVSCMCVCVCVFVCGVLSS